MSKSTAKTIVLVLALGGLIRAVWAYATGRPTLVVLGGKLVAFTLFGLFYLASRARND